MADNALSDAWEEIRQQVTKRPWLLLIPVGLAAYFWFIRPNIQGGQDTEGEEEGLELDGGPFPGDDRIPGPIGDDDDDDDSSSPSTIDTNLEWERQAIDFLTARGFAASFAQAAVTKALTGQPLTVGEMAAVSLAMAALGNPPDGMPPLSEAPPPPSSTPTKPGSVANLRATNIKRDAATLDWSRPSGSGSMVYEVQRIRPSTGSVVRRDGTLYTTHMRLKPNTSYTFQVRARTSAGIGPWKSVTFRTKK